MLCNNVGLQKIVHVFVWPQNIRMYDGLFEDLCHLNGISVISGSRSRDTKSLKRYGWDGGLESMTPCSANQELKKSLHHCCSIRILQTVFICKASVRSTLAILLSLHTKKHYKFLVSFTSDGNCYTSEEIPHVLKRRIRRRHQGYLIGLFSDAHRHFIFIICHIAWDASCQLVLCCSEQLLYWATTVNKFIVNS